MISTLRLYDLKKNDSTYFIVNLYTDTLRGGVEIENREKLSQIFSLFYFDASPNKFCQKLKNGK